MLPKRIPAKDMDLKTKQKIIAKIIENDFTVNDSQSELYICLENDIYCLNNDDTEELVYSDIKKRVSLKQGMDVDSFFSKTATYSGYKLFNKIKRPEFQPGELIEDNKQHGLYFTIDFGETFRFLLSSYFENEWDFLAEISLISPHGIAVNNASIVKGSDTEGTYRARAFYIARTQTLNNYDLVLKMYQESKHKNLILDTSECGMYKKSIRFFEKKQFTETVRALQEISKMKDLI